MKHTTVRFSSAIDGITYIFNIPLTSILYNINAFLALFGGIFMKKDENGDLQRLLNAMAAFGDNDFTPVCRDEFDDPEVADRFNEMLDKHNKRNNHFMVRINDAQNRIADTSCVKAMLDEITKLQDVSKNILEARTGIETGNSTLKNSNGEFIALAYQIRDSFEPCLVQMRQTEKILESIDIPSEDSYTMRKDSDFWGAVAKLKKYVSQMAVRMDGIGRRMDSLISDAEIIFDESEKKASFSTGFMRNVDKLTEGYNNLSAECVDTGRHLYKISRDVDNARNDMFRHNSNPTMLDKLNVFYTDHLTLSWRLYNNMVEFESLRVSQLNNPMNCKFGLWLAEIEDPRILGSEELKRAREAHFELHKLAVECYEAKLEYNMNLAKQKFDEEMGALERFKDALEELSAFLVSIGITEKTDIWKYRG